MQLMDWQGRSRKAAKGVRTLLWNRKGVLSHASEERKGTGRGPEFSVGGIEKLTKLAQLFNFGGN